MDANAVLFDLVRNHKWDRVKEYLSKNDDIDVNIRDSSGNYLMTYAVLFNRIDIVTLLIHRSAKLDIVDGDGRSVLYIAVKYEYVELLKLLLNFNKTTIGVSLIDIQDANRSVPLHYAIQIKSIEMCKAMIEAGSNVNIKDANGNSALHLAVYSRDLEICRTILNSHAKIDSKNNAGETPLHIAANIENLEIIEFLLHNGADVNNSDYEHEYTPLLYAVNRNSSSVTSLLLKNGADPNHQDYLGNTALHFAIIENNREIFIQLTQSVASRDKINFNLYNFESKLPAHIAAENENYQYLETLLPKTDLNLQSREGDSVMHILVRDGVWKRFIDLIKNSKINMFVKNRQGRNVFDYVDSKDHKQFIDLVADSYLYRLRNRPYTWKTSWENICRKEMFANKASQKEIQELEKIVKVDSQTDACKKAVVKKLLDAVSNLDKNPFPDPSYPEKQGYVKVDIGDDENTEFCSFTGVTLDILVGLLVLLKKHRTACSTLTENFVDNEKLCSYYKQLGVIADTNCEFLNFEIVWVYHKLYLSERFFEQFDECIKGKRRFTVMPLGIELREGSHANYLIYDKKLQQIERFEPYGSHHPSGFDYNPDLLDSVLKSRFEVRYDVTYIPPKNFLPRIGFQVFESYERHCAKIGDPKGFCALWSLWYADKRLSYPDLDRQLLVKEIIRTVKQRGMSFRNIIRDYSKSTVQLRDQILNSADIDINDWINDKYSSKQLTKVVQKLRSLIAESNKR